MKISIIIPIYKVEKYLEQCVMSVLNQTYRDVEVILVDDGSPDGCPAMCDAFAEKDVRIKVIHKLNGGLSDARNAGTRIASGDYIMYLDSDDFWSNSTDLEMLVNAVKETPECDFVCFNSLDYYEDRHQVIPWLPYDEIIQSPIHPTICILKLVSSGVFPMSAWMKIIKRELVQNKLEFIKGTHCEDIPWFIELMKISDKCRFVNHYMYMYRKGVVGSISGSYSHKTYRDLFNLLKDGVAVNQKDCDGKVRDALFSFWAYELCILRAMTGFMDRNQRNKELKELYKFNWLFDYQMHPKVRKVALVQRYFGKRITNLFLHQYLKTRLA